MTDNVPLITKKVNELLRNFEKQNVRNFTCVPPVQFTIRPLGGVLIQSTKIFKSVKIQQNQTHLS